MEVACKLADTTTDTAESAPVSAPPTETGQKVKGTATCSHCGNEAEMWITL
ncbi:MAG: hypothetical protein QNJ22_15405 [Desulfosarcinaceae bacterium]|nr:hypothetical protein [Desulfosarcinaceae bacterium]